MGVYFQKFFEWYGHKNERNFIIGILVLIFLYYIYRGEDAHEKLMRLFKIIIAVVVVLVTFSLLYSFSK